MNTKTETMRSGDTFELYGLKFRFTVEADEDGGTPWDDDCTGDVRELCDTSDKKPGERILHNERRCILAYDWQGAIKKARAEGWGIEPARRAEWETRIGRKLTRGEIAAAAVENDFKRLRGWCRNEWYYLGVIVELLDVDGNGTGNCVSLWRIESDQEEYQSETAHELAHTLARGLGLVAGRHPKYKANKRKHIIHDKGARFERVKVRP